MGFWQCLPFSWTTLRGKHCRHPIAVMGVVDTFEQYFHDFVYVNGKRKCNDLTGLMPYGHRMKTKQFHTWIHKCHFGEIEKLPKRHF